MSMINEEMEMTLAPLTDQERREVRIFGVTEKGMEEAFKSRVG